MSSCLSSKRKDFWHAVHNPERGIVSGSLAVFPAGPVPRISSAEMNSILAACM
jgi:hypothetical protein